MNELVKEKFELLFKDLKDMQKTRNETGHSYFTEELFIIRVKEIYDLLKDKNE